MKKFVKESLNDESPNYEAWKEKIVNLFKNYLPWKGNEDDIEDCVEIWWTQVVEPGWSPNGGEWISDEYAEKENEIIGEIANELGLPEEIFYQEIRIQW